MNVMGWADQQLATFGEFEALVYEGWSWSNHDLHEHSRRLAGGLVSRGLEPGDRVVLWLPNGVELVQAFTAVVRAGAVAVILSDTAPKAEVQRALADTAARALVAGAPWDSSGSAARPELLLTRADLAALTSSNSPMLEPVERAADDLAQIVYTSGSSGLCKGVAWTHGVIQARYSSFADVRPAGSPSRRALCVLPLSAAFGAQYLYLRLLQKMTLVLMRGFQPQQTLAALREQRIQTAMLVPSMAEALLACTGGEEVQFPSLGSLLIGGATVAPSLVRRLRRQWKVRVSSVYGLTELGPVARTSAGDSSGSLGKLGDGIEARVVTAPGDEGNIGEIQVRAPALRAGYYGAHCEVVEEWLPTGDLGYLDDKGELHLVGRRHELILSGGMNIYPQPLEDMLSGHPAVADCAVVGVQDPYLGEEVVAWVVPVLGVEVSEQTLLAFGREQVDARRAPARILFREAIPRNDGGKIERQSLREEALRRRDQVSETPLARQLKQANPARRTALLQDAVSAVLAGLVRTRPPYLGRTFGELGLDSMLAVQLANSLAGLLGQPLPATITFEFPTLETLCENLLQRLVGAAPQPIERISPVPDHAVAIVGAACRLPGGVDTPEQFWRLLGQGRSTTEEIRRWKMSRYYDPQPGVAGKTYTRSASLIDQERFDVGFFGLNFSEGQALDPQHRLALEVSWQALEQAGYAPRSLGSSCGVFLGISGSNWGGNDPLGRLPSMGAGRIAHLLDLGGPVLALDTACSSGLVAVHTALQNLRLGQCDLALAGAVNVIASPDSFVALSQIRALSSDGLCKGFDAAADGFGRGEGCVMLVLQRLDEAVAKGSSILAVIRGSAVNHDGRSSSLTAPHGAAQQAVARAALQDAGVGPEEIDFLEAHGSGTPLGDPIEMEAAMAVYGKRERPLLVGSVKSNLGHLEAAAGAVGLLKAALSLHHGQLPAHLHFQELPPQLRRYEGRMMVPRQLTPLSTTGLNKAAVTSLGMGGTNAAVIVEAAPAADPAEALPVDVAMCLSARTPEALAELVRAHLDLLEETAIPVADLGYTSTVGRCHFEYRLAVVGADTETLAQGLRCSAPSLVQGRPRVAFLFTGQGSLYEGAGRELFESEPKFREALRKCGEVLEVSPGDLWAVPMNGPEAQPALFALEWSLAQLWMSWGVSPEWMLGHSLGEYVAACLAGVFSLEEGLRLVAARGRLMAGLAAGGGMLSVAAKPEQVASLLGSHALEVAALNGPLSTVVSGHGSELGLWESELKGAGLGFKRLPVATAFHSSLLEPMLADFERELSTISFRPPQIDIISTVTGCTLSPEQACSVAYWSQGLRRPVMFAAAVASLAGQGANLYLEVGPQPVLCALGPACLPGRQNTSWVPTLRRGQPERRHMLESLGRVYEAGLDPDWSAVYSSGRPRRVSLPTYPFHVVGRGVPPVPLAGKPTVTEIVTAVLGGQAGALAEDENLLERGLDSLRVMQLVAELERHHGRRLSPAALLSRPSIAGIAALLAGSGSRAETARPSPLVRIGEPISDPEVASLFCVHPAGGQIGVYLQFRQGHDRSLYAIASRGLNDVSQEAHSLAQMVEDYAALIQAESPRGPLALLGWSFGAMVAHSVAGALERAGREVVRVTMIDPPRAGLKMDLAACLLAVLSNYSAKPPGITELRRKTKKKGPEELWSLSLAEGWLDQEVLSSQAFSNHLQLHGRHVDLLTQFAATPISAPIVLCWAKAPAQPDWWQGLSRNDVTQMVLGGDHYSIMRPPRVGKILSAGSS